MKSKFVAVLLSLALVGCTTLGNMEITEASNFVAVKVGQSDRSSVYGKFGQPDDVQSKANGISWRYVQVKSSPEPATFVLGVLIWPLVLIMQTEYAITQTDFEFDATGKLVDVTTRKGEKRLGLLGAASTLSDENQAANREAMERVRTEMGVLSLPYNHKMAEMSQRFFSI